MNNNADSLVLPAPSMVEILQNTAQRVPSHTALTVGNESITYETYRNAVWGLATHWSSLIEPGDRIVLILGNSINLAIGMYSAQAAGAQVVPLNPGYSTPEMQQMLADANPRLIIHGQTVADMAAICSELPNIIVSDIGADTSCFRDFADNSPPDLPAGWPRSSDLATLQYTGGTSGRAKGVNITHGHLVANQVQREALLPTEYGNEVMLCSMPLFHVSAVAMCLHMACFRAAHLVILPRYRPDWMLEAIAHHQVTLISAAPRIYQSLLSYEGFNHTNLKSLRWVYSGAASLPQTIRDQWETTTGAPLLEGYGMTEAGPVLTYNPAKGIRKANSVGIPVPWSSLEIVDAEDRDRVLAPGKEGEIRVAGPHIMAGYRGRPAETAAALAHGWLYTGDIGWLDEEGYLFITGRKGERIKINGFTVYPSEVDEVLLQHPSIAEAAAFRVEHPGSGQAIHAGVVLRPGVTYNEESILAHCRESLVSYKVPKVIHLLQKMPVTGVGKLARNKLPAACNVLPDSLG